MKKTAASAWTRAAFRGWALWAGMTAGAALAAVPAPEAQARAEQHAKRIATELASVCPIKPAGDQAAFDACREGMFRTPVLRSLLPDFVLWGRQKDPARTLKDTNLTQFAPDVITGMYLPLFMFSGEQRVVWHEKEKLFQLRLRTAFRNRLAPGQFPYPFWHEEDKWSTYENAAEIIFWWSPQRDKVTVAQFTAKTELAPLQPHDKVAHAFDGQWMWTDAQGQAQPKATLFDGVLHRQNPYAPQVDAAYRKLALRLRDGQCNECHVPNNPDSSKRLVLLQTPAHAAGEIGRLLKSVREDRMPRDEFGIAQPLDAKTKAALLEDGEAFEKVLQLARQWEGSRPQAAAR
ncbi:hypothetical protein [Ideonella livida]|uniref:Cytochrome c domain-containing protein n=1 Tax=Ideonella livida TaxID=2707176 RepID=A0A7C9TNQ7_9BURK|nr:hypothetical protein [Ideonella livida]NDY92726.1 hypothetical protein [Ideonella livida]